MAGTELHVPIVTAMVAAVALLLLVLATPLLGRDSWWAFVLAPIALLGATFWGWIASYRKIQALDDIPLSRIFSAPQGYVRLEGRAAAFPGKPLSSPLTYQACCWYSYRVVESDRGRGNAIHEENDTSDWSFMLDDGTGQCVVDPTGAKLIPVRTRNWRNGDFHYVESLVLPGDPVFVIGQFSSSGASVTEYDLDFRVGELVAEWKKDMPALRQRFELTGDGEFHPQQWEHVRSEARREIEADIASNPPQPQDLVSIPKDGRPFIISVRSRRRLKRDLRIWAWLHLAGFLIGVAVLAALVFRHA